MKSSLTLAAILGIHLVLASDVALAQSYNTFNSASPRSGMTGVSIPILPRTLLGPFSASSAVTHQIVLANHINVASARELSLIVRAHLGTTITGTSQIQIYLVEEAPTTDDPATDFAMPVGSAIPFVGGPMIISSFSATPPYGNLYVGHVQNTTPFGAFVRLVGVVTAPTAGSTYFSLSADLVPKS